MSKTALKKHLNECNMIHMFHYTDLHLIQSLMHKQKKNMLFTVNELRVFVQAVWQAYESREKNGEKCLRESGRMIFTMPNVKLLVSDVLKLCFSVPRGIGQGMIEKLEVQFTQLVINGEAQSLLRQYPFAPIAKGEGDILDPYINIELIPG